MTVILLPLFFSIVYHSAKSEMNETIQAQIQGFLFNRKFVTNVTLTGWLASLFVIKRAKFLLAGDDSKFELAG